MNQAKDPWPGNPLTEKWKLGKKVDDGTGHVQIITESRRFIVGFISSFLAERIVADHNALAGVEKPGEAMELARRALKEGCGWCEPCVPNDCMPDQCVVAAAKAALGETDP